MAQKLCDACDKPLTESNTALDNMRCADCWHLIQGTLSNLRLNTAKTLSSNAND